MKTRFFTYIIVTVLLIAVPCMSDSYVMNSFDRYGRSKTTGNTSGDGFSYFWRSLIVPGWGEYKLGHKKQAAMFFVSDILLITAAFGFNYYSGIRTDEYREYASLYAGVDTSGKKQGYWVNISNYDNTADYNDSRNVRRLFNERYTEEKDQWYWESSYHRTRYNEVRISAEKADTWFYYAVGGAILNRFLSALNASGKASNLRTQVHTGTDGRGNFEGKLEIKYGF